MGMRLGVAVGVRTTTSESSSERLRKAVKLSVAQLCLAFPPRCVVAVAAPVVRRMPGSAHRTNAMDSALARDLPCTLTASGDGYRWRSKAPMSRLSVTRTGRAAFVACPLLMQGLARVPRLQWLPGCGAALNGPLEDRGERLHEGVGHLIDGHRTTELELREVTPLSAMPQGTMRSKYDRSGRDVEGQAVAGDPAGDAHADGPDLPIADPCPAEPGDAACCDAIGRTQLDHRRFQIAHVAMDVLSIRLEIEDGYATS